MEAAGHVWRPALQSISPGRRSHAQAMVFVPQALSRKSALARTKPPSVSRVLVTTSKTRRAVETEKQVVVPVTEERARLLARRVTTDRVLVRTEVATHVEPIEALLRDQEVLVERVPVGREVESIPQVREEGGTLIVPVVEEELVVRTRLLLKEEVRVTRVEKSRQVRREVPLRRQTVTTERLPVSESPSEKEESDGQQ